MGDLKAKIEGLLANKGVMTGREWRVRAEEEQRKRQAGQFEIDKVVPGAVEGADEDGFYLVRADWPLDTPHGDAALGDALSALPEHVALSACDAGLRDFDPRRAVFLDTETTGLMGGTGTVAFLVGAGFFSNDIFRLEQCFMRDFDDEEPMLEYLAQLLSRFDTVVTYNGKSFDLPLLRTRFIQNRMRFPLDSALHLDLLHAARRLWKKRLAECGLTSIEQHVLGIQRQGDVSSADIPRRWLDYLRQRDARPLEPVFYHHRMDILSLAVLTARLSNQLEEAAQGLLAHTEDEVSLMRVLFRQKRYEEVAEHGDRLIAGGLSDAALRSEVLEMLAYACKRLQRFPEMQTAWQTLVGEFPENLRARHELAKHLENRARDLPAALRLCRETLQLFEMKAALGGEPLQGLGDFEKRAARIERKLRARGFLADQSDSFSSD